MLWFIGIVMEQDMNVGITIPSYILRITNAGKWVIVSNATNTQSQYKNAELAVFNSVTDEHAKRAVEYMACLQESGVHVKGSVFWYPCDWYGRQKGVPLFVCHTPLVHYRDPYDTIMDKYVPKTMSGLLVRPGKACTKLTTSAHPNAKRLRQQDVYDEAMYVGGKRYGENNRRS